MSMASTTTTVNTEDPARGVPQSLSNEINFATRYLHGQLNRLIISRLPLCLPPHTATPQNYLIGLQHFAQIYLTFESLFYEINLQCANSNSTLFPPPVDSDPLRIPKAVSKHDTEVREFLGSLPPPGLPRFKRLLADLSHLQDGREGHPLESISQSSRDKLQAFTSHIKREVSARPHILIAYAWCFYMAVFSGGRWIRGQLKKAGDDFWQNTQEKEEQNCSQNATMASLSLWYFDGEEDGEDIKREFKLRLADGERIFTRKERADIIAEAKYIFESCQGLVEELDQNTATPSKAISLIKIPIVAAGEILPSSDSGSPASPSPCLRYHASSPTAPIDHGWKQSSARSVIAGLYHFLRPN